MFKEGLVWGGDVWGESAGRLQELTDNSLAARQRELGRNGLNGVLTPVEGLPIDRTIADDSFRAQGLCAQTDPELFYPEKRESAQPAKKICQECPVRLQCLEYALKHDERFGVWGGLSERERRALKKQRV